MRRALLTIGLALMVLAPWARAADSSAVVFEFRWSGLDAVATSPKDAFLRRAASHLAARIDRLADEFPEEGAEAAGALSIVWESLYSPSVMRLEIEQVPDSHPRIRLLMSVTPKDPARAGALARAAAAGFEQNALDSTQRGPVRIFQTESGEVAVGVRKGSMILSLNGLMDAGAPATHVSGAPADLPLTWSIHLDGDAFGRFIDIAGADEPAETAEARRVLDALQLTGEDALVLDGCGWRTADAIEGTMVVRNARGLFAAPGADPPMLADSLATRIPADATAVNAFAVDLGFIARVVNAIDPEALGRISEQSKQALGFDIINDLFAHVGPGFASFQTDRAGGPGLMSSMVLAQLKDPEAFATTHDAIVDRVNSTAAMLAKGFVRIAPLEMSGHPGFLLTAPGLPVPIAPAWAIVDGALVAGATPNAFDVAASPPKGKGILSNPAIAARLGSGPIAGLTYSDTAHRMPARVGVVTGMLIAFANLSRTPLVSDEGGLPTATELCENVKPSIGWSRWAGDDLVCRWTGDGSVTVVLGDALADRLSISNIQMMSMGAGVLLPALESARNAAIRAKENAELNRGAVDPNGPVHRTEVSGSIGSARVRRLCIGISLYCANHDGAYPESLADLVASGVAQQSWLVSPFGPGPIPDSDYIMCAPAAKALDVEDPRNTILVVDAAAMASLRTDLIPIGMADGSVREVSPDELDEMLSHPQNAPMKSALGLE